MNTILTSVRRHLIVVSVFISLIISDVEHLCICLLAIYISSLGKSLGLLFMFPLGGCFLYGLFIYFRNQAFVGHIICKCFLPTEQQNSLGMFCKTYKPLPTPQSPPCTSPSPTNTDSVCLPTVWVVCFEKNFSGGTDVQVWLRKTNKWMNEWNIWANRRSFSWDQETAGAKTDGKVDLSLVFFPFTQLAK